CTGQLSIVAAVALVAALDAQGRGRPIWAGVWLTLASIKTATMLPFLLLFLRRSDLKTWITLACGVIFLSLLGNKPIELPGRVELMLQHIKELEQPGMVNDYTFEGTQHVTMLGFDHALYRLGLRDRAWIRVGQWLILLALTVWVGRQFIGRN